MGRKSGGRMPPLSYNSNERFLKCLACGKGGMLGGGYGDCLAGLGISAISLSSFLDLKGTETNDLDLIALMERGDDGVRHRIDGNCDPAGRR